MRTQTIHLPRVEARGSRCQRTDAHSLAECVNYTPVFPEDADYATIEDRPFGRESLEGATVRIIAGPTAGITATVIVDADVFVVVTFDNRAGEPVRRNVPRESVVVLS